MSPSAMVRAEVEKSAAARREAGRAAMKVRESIVKVGI